MFFCRQSFFINNRFVKSRTAQAALEQAFTSYIPPEKYPCCVMNIGLNPARVDVNVHPAKLEVKFSNEKPVFEAVYYAVRQALEQNITRPEFAAPEKKPLVPEGRRVSDLTTPIEIERPESLGKRQIAMDVPAEKPSRPADPPRVSSVSPSSPSRENLSRDTNAPGGESLRTTSKARLSVEDHPPIQGRITAEDYVRYYVNRDKIRQKKMPMPEFIGTVRIHDPEPNQPAAAPSPAPIPVDEIPMDVYEAEARALFGDAPPAALPVEPAVPADVPEPPLPIPAEPLPEETAEPSKAVDSPAPQPPTAEPISAEAQPDARPYRMVGEVFHSYVIVEQGDRMLLIDKHAAHERIIFEQLKANMKEKAVDSQLLMLPMEIMLMSEEVGLLDAYRAELEAVGFTYTCQRFTVRVESIPSGIAIEAVPDMMAAIAEQLKSGVDTAKLTRDILFEKALYQASCKAAIKAGRDYPTEHIAWLVDKLMELPDVTFCPHGRPVAMEMKKRNIDHQFERC